jgi:signal transduction histidine kinase
VRVRLVPTALDGVPETVGVVAYRVVQESLSNVVRHAPGATATVQVTVRGNDLLVGVLNSAPPVPVGTPAVEERGARRGHGLRGMRERVELTGGAIDHGPTDDGGFQVRARLPLSHVPAETPETSEESLP